jgi:hypothetical protein
MHKVARRAIASTILLSSLLLPWGFYDYTSSLGSNGRNHVFTGLDALRQQVIIGCLSCMGYVLLILCWLLLGKVLARHRPASTTKRWGWEFVLFGIAACASVAWLRVLSLALAHERERLFMSSIWYRDLSPGFWIFPACLLLAIATRFLPVGHRPSGELPQPHAEAQPGSLTAAERAETEMADEAVLIGSIVMLGMTLLGCSLTYIAIR